LLSLTEQGSVRTASQRAGQALFQRRFDREVPEHVVETSARHAARPSGSPRDAGRLRALRSWLRSDELVEQCWWWLLFVAATCVAKLAYLDRVYARNVGSALEELVRSSTATSPWLVAGLVVARDIVQTALLAIGLFAMTAPFSSRTKALLRRGAALGFLLVLGANHISFSELGTFVSKEALTTSWGWVMTKPEVLRSYMTPLMLLTTASVGLWIMLPSLMVRVARLHAVTGAMQRTLPALALSLLVAGFLLSPLATQCFGERAFPIHGYWSSVARAAWGREDAAPTAREIPAEPVLLAQYRGLAFPQPAQRAPEWLMPSVEQRIRSRHVLVVGLETAPKAFYPLTIADDLPTFRRMAQRAIISDQHYTTSPYTRLANFSMLSGLYAPPSGLPTRFGSIAADGFAAVLRARGYETTYVDSWVLDWQAGSGERAQAQMLGFDAIVDNHERRDDGVWEVLVRGEQGAFDTAYAKLAEAQDHGRHAAVFLGTMLGHAPWPAAKGQEALTGPARMHEVARVFDGLFARLLERLSARGLSDDVLILIVGDHGLRLAAEFESLGLTYSHSDLAYNVPFVLYAPGLIDETVHVPFATSHVDIAPTLLHLVGEATEGMLHHGGYVLDGRLASRVVYLPSSRLGPLDGYTWRGNYVTHHALSGVAQLGFGADAGSMQRMSNAPSRAALPPALQDPAALLEAFDKHTTLVGGALLRRAQRSAEQTTRAAL
jgi:hypothetical protein